MCSIQRCRGPDGRARSAGARAVWSSGGGPQAPLLVEELQAPGCKQLQSAGVKVSSRQASPCGPSARGLEEEG
ncbi:unnamed protein product [Boreogadus saida]